MAVNTLPLGELAAAQALLNLSEAAVGILGDISEEGEPPEETVTRLATTYGTINVPVGIRAVPLLKLLRALLACRAALAVPAEDLAPYVAQVAQRSRSYGPQRRQMTRPADASAAPA